ncbi:hypothetical protein DK847_02980 [Aestuariivirga litoralis]|uniref:O-antigen ligase-related domain-containing protein n=1 Tax=Aestuariivirga litoralis TaxID=2650924 RepID=A0A2W2BZ67_9HYPH|nr:O-antigen ligase family protein [Aestuariivirga litoralis]PZF78776.1 hypothetical protein DK847_02980 [Aestuariivirga litoralis]
MSTATWTDRAPGQERALGHWAWPATLSFALLLAIVSGGSSQADSWAFLLFRLICIGILGVALLRLLSTKLARTEVLALLLVIAAVALVALQLVPLPFALFESLPGRAPIAKIFSIAGIPPQMMPMTLSPEATLACILTLLPPIAFFVALLTSGQRARWMLVGAILLGSIANTFLGLAQRLQGAKGGLYLYDMPFYGSATGFFSNRNNFAMLLCVAIPLTWALTQKLIRGRVLPPVAALAGGAVMMLIILMGLAASGSRSGILLGMLALTLSTLMVLVTPQGSDRGARRGQRAKMSVFAILGAAFIIGQFGMTGLLRIADSDPLTDSRSLMRRTTISAAAEYFPLGSGFGTFRPVYGMHEQPSAMERTYVNHAHNDWLELWLEGGVPAAILMACFLALFAYQTLRVWNPRGAYAEQVLPRAASIVALVLMLHSLVEFPLRMPSLACIFAGMMAILMAAPAARQPKPQQRQPSQRRRKDHGETHPERPAPPPAATTPPVFRVPRGDDDLRPRDGAGAPTERLTRR